MTQEEKEKVYIELINRLEDVKEAIKKQNYGIAMNVLCKPYPEFQVTTHSELKDEDERIRKTLIKYFRNCVSLEGINGEDISNWLEKQGNLMKALQISNAKIGELIEKNYYLKEQLEKQGKNNMGISEATKQELEDNLNKALEKETPESLNKFLDEQGEQKTVIKMKTPEESLGIDSDTYNKIVDECVYGDQKPAWGEEDIELLDNTIKFIEDRVAATSPSLRTYSPTLTGKEIPFLKALKDRVQPKQEWSEEDEKILNLIIARLHSHPSVEAEEYVKDYHWFKAIKNRVQLQNGYNPYKEVVESIAEMCKHYDKASHSGLRDFYDNVKVKCNDAKEYDSLFPQSQWKPSDEQMSAINTAINVVGKGTINGKYLIELQEQLKKLMEK